LDEAGERISRQLLAAGAGGQRFDPVALTTNVLMIALDP
jgi:hypothetical protein